jgi:hypothetical protein
VEELRWFLIPQFIPAINTSGMNPGHEPMRVLDYADPSLPPIEPASANDLQQVAQTASDTINTEVGWSLLIEIGGNVLVSVLESMAS